MDGWVYIDDWKLLPSSPNKEHGDSDAHKPIRANVYNTYTKYDI